MPSFIYSAKQTEGLLDTRQYYIYYGSKHSGEEKKSLSLCFIEESELKIISKVGMLYGHIYIYNRQTAKEGIFFWECGN